MASSVRVGGHFILKKDRYAGKKWAKKNAAPRTRFWSPKRGKNDYLASPSSAGLSERSTGLSPSQMRRIAL